MRRAVSLPTIVVSIIVLGLALFVWTTSSGRSGGGTSLGAGALYEVSRGGFEITVPTSGELSALDQVNIHNALESNAVIIELVEEGTRVKAGDVLLRLNDESIRNAIRDAQDTVTTSANNLDGATANLIIYKKRRDVH